MAIAHTAAVQRHWPLRIARAVGRMAFGVRCVACGVCAPSHRQRHFVVADVQLLQDEADRRRRVRAVHTHMDPDSTRALRHSLLLVDV